MLIRRLKVVNFRCFTERLVSFNSRFVIIHGNNGSGKSSLLEALHYGCYLRSFRTHLHRDLITLEKDHFFIQLDVEQEMLGLTDQILVGFSMTAGKLVKHNEKPIQSYKELVASYRVVTLAADDLSLVHGVPDERRNFLNYGLCLAQPALFTELKKYRQILDHRNSLLQTLKGNAFVVRADEFEVWSKKLWEVSQLLKAARIEYLQELEKGVNRLLQTYFQETDAELCVRFFYKEKSGVEEGTFETFWQQYQKKYVDNELSFGRSFFGIHLDDFIIFFQNKKARIFASRGQQKLIVFLIKVAQLLSFKDKHQEPGILLLDDFLTDFDDRRLFDCVRVLQSLPFQIIVTCPTKKLLEHEVWKSAEIINLENNLE